MSNLKKPEPPLGLDVSVDSERTAQWDVHSTFTGYFFVRVFQQGCCLLRRETPRAQP